MEAIEWGKMIGQIAAGGLPTWIVTGVLILMALGLYFWIKKKAREQAWNDSKKKETEDQAGGTDSGQDAENAANDAQKKIDEAKKQNPDGEKEDWTPEE